MSSQTDNTWPAGLLSIFEHCRDRHETFENCYSGSLRQTVELLFREWFRILRRTAEPPVLDSHDAINFIVMLVVSNGHVKPVLLIEVKDDTWAQKAELRFCYRADIHMCRRYALMLDDCPVRRP
jgi:hypothetical protein